MTHDPHDDDRGTSTAEYAVGTLGACTVALVLHELGTDGFWLDRLEEIVRTALAWRNSLEGVPHIGLR